MKLSFSIIWILIIAFIGRNLHAQNLVPNSSFEQFFHYDEIDTVENYYHYLRYQRSEKRFVPKNFYECPLCDYYTILFCKDWTNSSQFLPNDSPDLYNKCSIAYGIPYSSFNMDEFTATCYQPAHTGNGYIGCFAFPPKINNKRHGTDLGEFIQTKLYKPLIRDQKYLVEFYVNRADFSTVSVDKIGLFFSKNMIKAQSLEELKKCKPQIINPFGEVISDTVNWRKITGTYLAKGGEGYIIIGDFYDEKNNVIIRDDKRNKNLIAYYFIDDVSVVPIDKSGQPIILYPELKNKSGDTDSFMIPKDTCKCLYRYKCIFFDKNDSALTEKSIIKLDNFVSLLNKDNTYKVEIRGHADNSGTFEYNMYLSTIRAQTVANYLISKGINKNRIDYKGYGNTLPAVIDTTYEGQAANRRVEYKIIYKEKNSY